MAVRFKHGKIAGVRLGLWLSLIFFVCLSIVSCNTDNSNAAERKDGNNNGGNEKGTNKNADGDIRFVYADHKADIAFLYLEGKAKSLEIPLNLLSHNPGRHSSEKEDLLSDKGTATKPNLSVVLKSTVNAANRSGVQMFGEVDVKENKIVFTPVVPFTAGRTYLVFNESKLLREVSVPVPDASLAPVVTAVYPSIDTLPENVLKLYILFSAPMREGEAVDHIRLIAESGDTLNGTFLNLQPELWNKEANVLTVWFDPGRIKRDLIPNVEKGNPLSGGRKYTLLIDSAWAGVNGLHLQNAFRRTFFTTTRDSISPQPARWKHTRPLAATADPLKISFHESLDYYLLQNSITIIDGTSQPVAGKFRIVDNERAIEFIPAQRWPPGKFKIRVAPVLEDLAGNNLNRPFERDNLRPQATSEKPFYDIPFLIPPVLQAGSH